MWKNKYSGSKINGSKIWTFGDALKVFSENVQNSIVGFICLNNFVAVWAHKKDTRKEISLENHKMRSDRMTKKIKTNFNLDRRRGIDRFRE